MHKNSLAMAATIAFYAVGYIAFGGDSDAMIRFGMVALIYNSFKNNL